MSVLTNLGWIPFAASWCPCTCVPATYARHGKYHFDGQGTGRRPCQTWRQGQPLYCLKNVVTPKQPPLGSSCEGDRAARVCFFEPYWPNPGLHRALLSAGAAPWRPPGLPSGAVVTDKGQRAVKGSVAFFSAQRDRLSLAAFLACPKLPESWLLAC